MKSVARNIFLALIFVAAGCTEPGRTTSVGAATVGVIGAGLGAIVGNQVGSAGAGLAIGAASGAAAGAAIGNALESNEKRFAQQEEKIKRQDQEIESQKKLMAELRKRQEDSSSAALRSSSIQDSYAWGNDEWGGKKSAEKWAKDPSVRYANDKEIELARAKSSNGVGRVVSDTSARARLAMGASASYIQPAAEPKVKEAMPPKVENVNAPSAVKPTAKLTTETKKSGSVIERDLTAAQTTSEEVPAAPIKVNEATKVEKADVTDGASALVTQDSEECKGAAQEATKAEAASETADKLFHIRRALRMCPNNADFHHELGKLYKYLGRDSDAKFEFDEAIRINPAHQGAKASLDSLGN